MRLEPFTELRGKFLGFKVRACLTVVTCTCLFTNCNTYPILGVLSWSPQLKGGSLYLSKGSLPQSRVLPQCQRGDESNDSKGSLSGLAGLLFQRVASMVLLLSSFAQSTEGRDFGWCWNLVRVTQFLIPKGFFSGKDLFNLPGWVPFDFYKLQPHSRSIRKSSTSANSLIKGTACVGFTCAVYSLLVFPHSLLTGILLYSGTMVFYMKHNNTLRKII